jgi:hypothetical protein
VAEVRTESRLTMLTDSVTHPAEQVEILLLGNDTEMFDALAVAVAVVPDELPYQHGAVVNDLIVRAVPRTAWPDKPLESNDRFVDHLFPESYQVSRAAPASSIVGSFFLDSGISTVVVGMFVLGVALKASWTWFGRRRHELGARLIFALFLPLVIVLLRGGLPHTLAIAAFTILPLVVGLRLARREPAVSKRTASSIPKHQTAGAAWGGSWS